MVKSPSPNKLASEKSPYLQQHANNPVNWYPWGEEAFSLAKATGKPIFLSIGYSTCHWCHVMAHESFEAESIAALLNIHFINIKVDREERPDIDAIYMTATQALTGSGGWPMSVWLTPDLKPFFAGTYFPPEDRHGRAGFPTVISQLADLWANEREKVLHTADQISEMLANYQRIDQTKNLPNATTTNEAALAALVHQYDSVNGGFGQAPKFPMPVYLEFLIELGRRSDNAPALEMAASTLRKMRDGGIYDQLGGGFSRYSTDERWLVPHFEKMLYDNAQLLSVAANLYDVTRNEMWRDLCLDMTRYLFRDLRHPEGGFFSAEDADSEGKEGVFYLWTVAQINQLLPEQLAKVAIERFGLSVKGNFFDPHTREEGQNVLSRTPNSAGSTEDADALKEACALLFEAREKRPRPHRDDKIITEWNGLMLSGLAKAARFLSDTTLLEEARKAAAFLKANLYDDSNKTLYRRWVDGHRAIEAHQSDYAMLVQGLLDLAEAGDRSELDWALELHLAHNRLFFDDELGGYFMTSRLPDLILRIKDDTDNVIPSGNSIAVMNGLRLSLMVKQPALAEPAVKTLKAFSGRMTKNPTAMVSMNVALFYASNLGLIR